MTRTLVRLYSEPQESPRDGSTSGGMADTCMEVSTMPKRTCSLDNCDRDHKARGFCGKHYQRWWKYGTTIDPLTSPETRFWPMVDTTGDCWEWQGTKDVGGYARFQLRGERHLVHRYAYELLVGPIPDGLHIDHLCRNRICVNPAHLEPVTLVENVMRGETVTARNAAKTHCVNGHPFDAANTRYRPAGGRSCRACARDLARRRRMLHRFDEGDG